MDYKTLLKRVLPVILIAIVIVVVAAVASLPKPNPKVTNPDEIVAEFGDVKITKGMLYEKAKDLYGTGYLLELIDRDIFKKYESSSITEKVNEDIAKQKDEKGEDKFLEEYKLMGIETEEGIIEYLTLDYLKDAAAREKADSEITEADVQAKYDDYRADVCAIILKYDTLKQVQNALDQLSDLEGTELRNKYFDLYENDEDNIKIESAEKDDDFDCEYIRIEQGQLNNQDLEDYIYDDLAVGESSEKDQFFSKHYYLVYKVSEQEKPTFDELKGELRTDLIDAKVTDTYKNDVVLEIRRNVNIVIYDSIIGKNYQRYDDKFKPTKASKENVVAVITIDGEEKEYTADQLYEVLKLRQGVFKTINLLDLHILESDGYTLSKDDKKEIKQRITDEKKKYSESGYNQYGITWLDYISYMYLVTNDDDLEVVFAKELLSERYVKDADPVTDTDVDNVYNKYFEKKVRHILIKFDEDLEESDGDNLTKEDARIKAEELITQLKETSGSELTDKFAELAEDNSADPGSAAEGGKLTGQDQGQYLTPLNTTNFDKDFMVGVKDLTEGRFSEEPVESQFGYHIIYVTDVKEKPEVDTDKYDDLLKDIRKSLEDERYGATNQQVVLAKLRDEKNFTFKDEDLQKIYRIYQDDLLTKDEEE